MTNASFRSLLLLGCAASLFACGPAKPCDPATDDNCPDDSGTGNPPKDFCNSKADAESDPRCQLSACSDAGMPVGCIDEGGWCYVSFSADQDFWLAPLPSAPTAGTLLHITGGYGAPETAVNFAITVLKEDGTTAVIRKVDQHGSAMPRPVDIILPFSDPKLADLQGVSGGKLLLLVGDEADTPMPHFDVRSPYTLSFCMQSNPDLNEPNDDPAMPTNLTLTAGANGPTATAMGYLATENDVDYFQFDASGATGKIIYVHVTGPMVPPFPTYRMEYTLIDPMGNPVASDNMTNSLLQIDLATARKVTVPGKYKVKLDGYNPQSGMMVPVPGDLTVQYTLTVEILDELDTNDTPANDTPDTAKVLTMGLNSSNGIQGRLSYVPDPDYFRLDFQPTSEAGILRYKLTVDQTAGRFAPLTRQGHVEDRQLRVLTIVTNGVDQATKSMNCIDDQATCPKGYDGAIDFNNAVGLVTSLCNLPEPLCLWAERDEDPNFDMNRPRYTNMEGEVPVPPHPGATVSYLIVSQDDETDYADDRVYTLQVSYEDDPDETMRDGLPNLTQTATLANGPSFPNPPATGQVSGELTFGYGRLTTDNTIDWLQHGKGVRGAQDYDAFAEDYDRFRFDFPGGVTGDQTWELQWDVDDANDGGSGPPGDLALEVTLCNAADFSDGGCPGVTPILLYSGDTLQPWYGQSLSDRQVLYSQSDNGTATTDTALPPGCWCYEAQTVAAGHYYMNVGAANRLNNQRIRYRIRQGYTSYPQSFTNASNDGGTFSCPSDGGVGGCGITAMP